jgi:hypothetical protein
MATTVLGRLLRVGFKEGVTVTIAIHAVGQSHVRFWRNQSSATLLPNGSKVPISAVQRPMNTRPLSGSRRSQLNVRN